MIKRVIRSYKRDPNLYNNIIGTAFIKCVSLILGVVTIRAYNHYFCNNTSIVGAWLTIVSILTWVVNFDLGLGNGLRNTLVKYISEKDVKGQKAVISSTYFMLIGVSIVISVAFCVGSSFLNWNRIINIQTDVISRQYLNIGIQIAFIGLVLQFVLKLVVSILYALKQTALGSLPVVLANALIFLFAIIFSNDSPEKAFVMISIAYAISMITPLIITSILVFSTIMKDARPSLKCFDRTLGKQILFWEDNFLVFRYCF